MEESKKILYNPRNNLFNSEEDHYKPVRIGNAFSSNYIEYKSNGNKGKTLLPKDYLHVIRPYLSDLINNHKTQGEWKIQITMALDFICSKDSRETRIMHTKSDNIEIMVGNETNKIIEKLFHCFLQRYQKHLEESMKESDFFFDIVDLLYYKFRKISLNRGGS